jgi:MYXO-CTERM domain-containing protein
MYTEMNSTTDTPPNSRWPLLMGLLGLGMLAGGIQAWPEGFLFGKVLRLPIFAEAFPYPLELPRMWVLISLVGPAFSQPGFLKAARSAAIVWLLAPAVALSLLPLPGHSPVANTAFNYLWIVLFHGLPALVVALCLKGAYTFSLRASRTSV